MRDTELLRKYRNWLQGTPQAFILFEKLANEVRSAGHDKYSAWTIVQVMRWHSDLKRTEAFKISNDYIACLARDLVKKDPSFETFFNLKTTKRI